MEVLCAGVEIVSTALPPYRRPEREDDSEQFSTSSRTLSRRVASRHTLQYDQHHIVSESGSGSHLMEARSSRPASRHTPKELR